MTVHFVSDVKTEAKAGAAWTQEAADMVKRATVEGAIVEGATVAHPGVEHPAVGQHELSLLHASRRLDWRFLLPDPTLANVGYVGADDQSLWASLELFAEKVTKIAPTTTRTALGGSRNHFDLVVAKQPTYAELTHAVDLVRPGGFLYVEVSSLLWSNNWQSVRGWQQVLKRIRLWNPQKHGRVLEQHGMQDVTAYWFWPNFARCTRMTPLDEPAAFRFLFATAQTNMRLKRRFVTAMQKAALGHRALNVLLPSVGIVATKSVYEARVEPGIDSSK